MASTGGKLSHEAERALRTIFKRCLDCPTTQPSCPACKGDEICSLVPRDCYNCAHMTCIANPNPAPKSSGPNVGAIAGGVVGGVAFVALAVFLVYWFWIRKRRQQQEADGWVEEDEEEEVWEEDDIAQQKQTGERRFTALRSQDAMSTRTRGSVANSILSRASNIIQIAFIPGVTTRNGSGHNSLLAAAPVPPVPAAQRNIPRSPLSNQGEALFFHPGDLRGSTYSGTSSIESGNGNLDTLYPAPTRQSITPSLARTSVASSTIYRDDATEVPMPVTQVVRAAPRMVSVRSTASTEEQSSGTATPDTAQTPTGKKPVQIMVPGQDTSPSHSSSIRSVASYGKPTQVSIAKSPSTPKRLTPSRQASESSFNTAHTSTSKPIKPSPLANYDNESDSEPEEEHARGKQELVDTSTSSPVATPLVQPVESPFFDASDRPGASSSTQAQNRPNPYASMAATIGTPLDDKPRRGGRPMGGLSAVIEEATKRASKSSSHKSLSQPSVPEDSTDPFGDKHSTE